MEEVIFYKGIKNKYNKALYGNGIYFATDTKEIIVNGVSYGSVDVDDELTEIGTNPVKGNSIYKAIKDTVTNAVNTAPYGATLELSASNNTYTIILRDKNGNKLSEVGPIVGELSDAVDISGLRVSRVGKQHLLVKNNQIALLRFTYDVWDSAGQSLGTSGKAYLYADENYETLLEEKVIPVGEHNFDVTNYLTEGALQNFYVKVVANTNKGEESYSLYYTVRLVNLSITSSFNLNTVTKVGDKINIPGTVTGISGLKTVRAYLNGVEANTVEVSGVTSNINLVVDTTGLTHGTHNIQLRADYQITDEYGTVVSTVYSNIIYYDVIVIEYGNSTPVFACRFDYEDGESLISGVPIVNAEQYNLFNLLYYVYDTNVSREVEFYSEGVSVGSNSFSDSASVINYRYTTSGIKNCYFECNNTIYSFAVNVLKSNYIIDEPTSSLSLYLDALGKSNNSSSRASWTYNDVTSTFENFNWSGNGWTGNSLKLFNGAKVTIHHQPFKAASTGALAFTIRFKVSNAIDENETLISCVDPYGYGLTITALEAKLKTTASEISTKFAADQTYTIGFVSFPKSNENSSEYGKNNSNMCYIYIDGIISGGITKTDANEIYQVVPQDIILLANNCELEVYSIRAYNTELTDDQMFNCHLIDLVDGSAINTKYEQNDILDLNGKITIDKIHGKIPYCVITGTSELSGVTQFDYISMIKDKDNKYDVDSILYVDTNPAFNFYCVSGSKNPLIRCQGTSSMGYPRKNYRIYTKNTSLYLGCDKNGEGGTLQDDPKYSMSATAAPVNCFCFKADYAESSSSHNTGTTGLVEEILANAGDLTPALKEVDKEKYPYQVRTTVEGKPCLMFHRNSVDEVPIFGGKFNFNNDKSTEDVFGFLEIPGYNDNIKYKDAMAEAAIKSLEFPDTFTSVTIEKGTEDEETFDEQGVLDILKGNPTECWEFLNNTSKMGNFLEADFDKLDPDSTEGELYWMTSWESRFPDEDGLNAAFAAGVKPYYLMNTAQWIVSTNVDQATGNALTTPVTYGGTQYNYDSAEYRKAKFRAELSNYFDVNYLCSYYMITECLAAADQRVKNMMWGFWYNPNLLEEHEVMGKMRCYPIFYDNDTILGLDNSGVLRNNWDADENTMSETDSYVFAGHDSTIWINLRNTCADYLEEAYKRLRNKNMTNATILKWYNTNQSDKYCERIYNKDAIYKYIIPANVGIPYTSTQDITIFKDVLAKMQGSRKAHRSWFIENRMNKYDAKYKSGDYTSKYIKFKGEAIIDNDSYASITAVPYRDWYFALRDDSAGIDLVHQFVHAGETFEYKLSNGRDLVQGDVFYLLGTLWMKELDMSNWGGHLEYLIASKMPVLEKLVLGGKYGSSSSVKLEFGNNTPSLKYLDILNWKITSLNLLGCIYLEDLIANGSLLAKVDLAEGCNIKNMILPETFTNLSLIGLPNLTINGILLAKSDNLLLLRVENCKNLDGLNLLNKLLSTGTSSLQFVRITGVNRSGNGLELINYMNLKLGGLDSAGGTIADKCKLVGTYKLTTLLDESVYKELCEYFDELNIIQPEYTTISFDLSITNSQKVTNHDNNTFGDDYNPSGHIKKILDQRHSYMVKNQGEGVFATMLLDDTNSNYYNDGAEARLDGTQGDYCMYEPKYWYKGINDYMNRKMYVLFSSNENCPKSSSVNDLRVTLDKCTLHKNKRVNASMSNLESEVLVDNPTSNYTTYSYIIPQDKQYKQIRVNTVASPSTGCVILDESGNVIKRLCLEISKGMHDASYLFGDLPENSAKVYFTINTDYSHDYYIYLTDSTELEAIEPDWVEHKECFVGRVISPLYNGTVTSAINSTYNSTYSGSYYYPITTEAVSVTEICNELERRGIGYYAADYEVLKDIIVLAYARYGGTGLHSLYVGAGANESGNFDTNNAKHSKYVHNGVKCWDYGIEDTKTSGNYSSYYEGSIDNLYPMIPTLLGYHQFINRGTTMSQNDAVSVVNSTYANKRTNRSVKLLNTANITQNYIMGGRFVDLFPINGDAGGSSTDGFCGKWVANSSIQDGTAYIEFGQVAGTLTPSSYSMKLVINTAKQVVTTSSLQYLQRVLIIPTLINEYTDSTLFISVS